ncbi:MAG TPA: FkbM family methyltransferase [Pirellulales bacterium]|jgi:FkbM family methyltransferase|nr:FkbM family methyltransferase [Pirellulales bacterium]
MSDQQPLNRLKQCRHGQMLFNPLDRYIGRSLDLYGEFSEGEVDLLRQVVQPGWVIVEVGAHIGCHSVFLAQQAGPTGTLIVFEPQRILFQTLCANLALNSLTNVFAFQRAVGAAPGSIFVPIIDYRREDNFGGVALGSYEHGESVEVVTIDSMELARCELIKIDVEGMELQVLEGARQTILRLKPIVYIENDRPEHSTTLIRLLDSLGYRMYWHAPPIFNPRNFFGNEENVFGIAFSRNMLCVHRDRTHNLQGFHSVEVPPEPTLQ